jgi:hypothetical protein
VQSFVLYGTAGTSVRKVTAEILAGIAAQAAIKAVFELAEGFAALALAFFGLPNAGPSASAHFAAAAIYGSIAGIAAISGRAIAGNSFKDQQQSGASTQGVGAGAGSNSRVTDQPQIIDIGRLRGAPPAPQVNLQVNVKQDRHSIVEVFLKDYQNNGKVRRAVLSDGVIVD